MQETAGEKTFLRPPPPSFISPSQSNCSQRAPARSIIRLPAPMGLRDPLSS